MTKDPEDSTSVSGVFNSDPDLLLRDVDDSNPDHPPTKEASVQWNRKKRKSRKERNPTNVHG